MEKSICLICERMRRASRLPPAEFKSLCHGGRREGAGRKPSTVQGILKKLPKQAAQLLERELRAKAELFMLEIKLEMLRKRNLGGENSRKSLAANSDLTANEPDQVRAT
jgi:hypothetical protein